MVVELRVILDEANGQVQVSGPLANKVLCYGMLEAAKDAIRGMGVAEQAHGPRIMPVQAIPPGLGRS